VHPVVQAVAMQIAATSGSAIKLFKARPSDYARNNAIRFMMANPQFSHLFLIDSDTEPPLDALTRLLALNSDIACGVYRLVFPSGLRWSAMDKKGGKYWVKKELPSKADPFIADGAGGGCLLIERHVLESMPWPWFKWDEHEDGYQEGEDVYFSRKCNDAGIRFMFDPMVKCIHHKEIPL
jgi:hypothetical protein